MGMMLSQIGLPTDALGLLFAWWLFALAALAIVLTTVMSVAFAISGIYRLRRGQRKGLRSLVASLCAMVIVVAGALAAWRSFLSPLATPSRKSPVEVWLAGRISQVKGFHWPYFDGHFADVASVEEPCTLRIHLPGGQAFDSPAKLIILTAKNDVIVDVNVLPLLEPVSFSIAVRAAEDIAARSPAVKDDRGLQKLRDFETSTKPTWPLDTCSARIVLRGGAEFFIEIRPTYHEGEWFLSLSFSKFNSLD